MDDKIHCFSYLDIKAGSNLPHEIQWMLGDKILFTEHFCNAFYCSDENAKYTLERLVEENPNDLIDAHTALCNINKGPIVFCHREKVDALLDKALEILNSRGSESPYSDSFQHRLQQFRLHSTTRFAILAERVDAYRRQIITEKIESLSESISANASVAQAIKRRRVDMAPVISALESMVSPKPRNIWATTTDAVGRFVPDYPTLAEKSSSMSSSSTTTTTTTTAAAVHKLAPNKKKAAAAAVSVEEYEL